MGLSVAVLLTAAGVAFEYFRLNGNLRDMPLFGGIVGDAGHERPDAFGRTPVNVLVIGSDTRAGSADCRLGGDCGPGQNADVDMVLHLSADRSHATVLSIPRDTVTDLPACRRPKGGVAPAHRGPVNSTLQFGPGCTVAAVHTLTGIPIDHFVLADFAGVVRLSDAVGGVPVCVDRNVYDPYSHLKLARGDHSLKGEAALEFLRSRHSFGDGSDLGRTDAQHLFLASLARRLRGSGSLTDPSGMLDLADAATKALTVDPGLASVNRLAGLAQDVRKVPSARFGFTTMPSIPDPGDHNRLVPGPGADHVFSMLAADVPPHTAGPARADGKAGQGSARPSATVRPGPDEAFEAPAGIATPSAPGVRTAAGMACAKVATGRVVTVRGVAMTPSAAFAATPKIPVSAP
ncbi:LCP family protein [Actinacidiphila acidipaludis]|uniref:LCP family protein n=1 Tax=Actinacidiphila acidipaludis TaxID=2873382 RepID=UPI0027E0F91A|nr:LCP family protein [Streptomyces acidipaludis]